MNSESNPKLQSILKRIKEDGFDFLSIYQQYLTESQVSIRSFLKSFRLRMSKQVKGKKKIYLDTKYWIRLREVFMGVAHNAEDKQIFEIINRLVNDKKIIIPLSSALYAELFLQKDLSTRKATAKLMDMFSGGIGIDYDYDLFTNEIIYLFTKYTHKELHVERDDFCWVSIGQIIGQSYLSNTILEKNQELAFQKALIDMQSHLKMIDLLDLLEEREHDSYNSDKERLASKLNSDEESLNHSKDDFKKIFMDEISGMVSLSEPFVIKAMSIIFEEVYGSLPEKEEPESVAGMMNMIYNMFKYEKINDEMPAYRILAGLNANVRCGLNKIKFEANDFDDFRHAALSLPYYDYFFTENNLSHLLNHKPTNYATLFNTIVKSKSKDVLEELKALLYI
ncbi:hypothetical protein [Leptospira dzoumogneensis]|uniref:Uncharacterized protein n=1 Tax=Leptospira dzoumogneensis TaxID=2484904 RepID=A0A4Z1AKZ7_9LEPT|nr:hypothetical protein [Leptospira dzoumogneensis]TGM97289.1 hypothetical protein EHR06_14150 [Leptospira dzoumogneensis]